MKKRKLRNLEVSSIGLGCMGFSQSYPPFIPKEEAIDVINSEIDKKWNAKLVYDFIQVLCIENAIEENILNY